MGLIFAYELTIFGYSWPVLHDCCSEIHLIVINVDKTKLVFFRLAPTMKKVSPVYNDPDMVQTVSNYLYLGIFFSSSGKFFSQS